ncbi:MAG TPA: 2-phospho-L-lactate transferase [Candidatus Sulfotelmatobacter sp.]|nr:2-phospho-L-lactate transferase [Candidatus Sulfotelmatobacter sp.]
MLAGGTGGAKLAAGLHSVLPRGHLTVVANTADDDEFWGLAVSPDVDAVIYRLAGVFNEDAGYGVANDSFHVLEALGSIGEDTWFRLGDRDIATHLLRSDLIRAGATPTEATLRLCEKFDLATRVLPMTDARVRTRFVTDRGELSFQEYFVRERLEPRLLEVRFAGIEAATATPQVLAALAEADLVIIGPSNPIISVGPMLELLAPRIPRARAIAVSPIVGGIALKGPTVEMMTALGHDPTPLEVARMYLHVVAGFALDRRDSGASDAIEKLGLRVRVCDTVMTDGGRALAESLLAGV